MVALLSIMIEVYLLHKTAHPLSNAQFAMLKTHGSSLDPFFSYSFEAKSRIGVVSYFTQPFSSSQPSHSHF